MRLSIIIPTLNEADWLPATLEVLSAHAEQAPEIIVADCASTDATLEVADRFGALAVAAPRDSGRAGALAAGCRIASGDILLFLDADTLLPDRFDTAIRLALSKDREDRTGGPRGASGDPPVVGGAFEMRFIEQTSGLRFVQRVNRLRYRLSRLFYGDQAVFVRKAALDRIGGVPQHRLMESAFMCRRLKRLGRLVLLEQVVETSGRRFLNGGVWPVFRHDLRLWLEFIVRRPIDRHAESYWRDNRER